MAMFTDAIVLCWCLQIALARVVFMHINESAGTSWMKWLKSYHATHCKPLVLPEAVDGCALLNKICSLKGPGFKRMWPAGATVSSMITDMVDTGCTFVELHHWDVSAALAFRAFGYEMMTIVRHPVSRVASMYNYMHQRKKVLDGFSHEFVESVRSPERLLGLLSGCDKCCSGLDSLLKASNCSAGEKQCARLRKAAEVAQSDGVQASPRGPACQATSGNISSLVPVAVMQLKLFDFVGLVEQMNETATLFCIQYGVCFGEDILSGVHNTHPKVIDIATEHDKRETLHKALMPDIEVYEQAAVLFSKQLVKRSSSRPVQVRDSGLN